MEDDQHRGPRVRQLERALQEREEHIAHLEARLEAVRDASGASERRARSTMENTVGTRSGTATDRASGRADVADEWGTSDGHHEIDAGGRDIDAAGQGTGAARHGTRAADQDAGPSTGDGRRDRDSGHRHGGADGRTAQFDPSASHPRSDARDGSNGVPPVVAHLRSTIEQLEPVTRKMLAHYHEYGPASPLDAHVVAGGDGDRTAAYRRNGVLREAALVAHVGRGHYATRLREIVVEAHGERLDEEGLRRAVGAVEEALPVASPPEMASDWPEP